ncbi:heavy metal translocating P-type ATPase [Robertkochia solimangrovi]|uniref:heavy metal translocating P-type ATPase n=1 Tax=Robertkochia solimangrovi TaxID=2213046 RepID=UPI001180BFF7|nr:heavy metal translocating P-type ATPase [Robertkochia solimangrovi]TRZ43175.1 cadmium-translocating P-type ATPase [Robertkochia solimangrovi]
MKKKVNLRDLKPGQSTGHSHDHDHSGSESHDHGGIREYVPSLVSLIFLIIGIIADQLELSFFKGYTRLIWYLIAYMPVGLPVLKQGLKSMSKGDVFTEFFLMSLATLGAFAIGEYPEGVAVMLFYSVGELFQHQAVSRARGSIRALLEVRPKVANIITDEGIKPTDPEEVEIGAKLQVRTGEKVPLDGVLISDKASLNMAALTGESKPATVLKGEPVYAGGINLDGVVMMEVTRKFNDSSIGKILDLVQHATARKSKTELFIRKFARIYTPAVVILALLVVFLPYFFTDAYIFRDWLYRGLIFLVISCPCALVISIPLGYFGGLGAASRNGILFKGASFLDAITKMKTLVMDKTGTVTKGIFRVSEVKAIGMDESELLRYLISLEEQSNHPIARAIREYDGESAYHAADVREIAGKGLSGTVNGKHILAGNGALMQEFGISIPEEVGEIVETIVLVSIDNKFGGYVIIADELKEDATSIPAALRDVGIHNLVILSGDKDEITKRIAGQLGIKEAQGDLLPEEKLEKVERIKAGTKEGLTGFMGDGINDAPVLAASDVGIAMGALGSDVAIETADVIIQTDEPSKVVTAVRIGKSTRSIVWQNILLAFGVKLIVLALGAGGLATMWEAVFADVGVALLAILNAVRLQRMTWK